MVEYNTNDAGKRYAKKVKRVKSWITIVNYLFGLKLPSSMVDLQSVMRILLFDYSLTTLTLVYFPPNYDIEFQLCKISNCIEKCTTT